MDILRARLDCPVTPESSFGDFGLDSLDLVVVAVDVEERFGIAIPVGEEPEMDTTVAQYAAKIERWAK